MADISKVRMLNGTEYNYKDAKARSDIEGLMADLGAQTGVISKTEGYYINLTTDPVSLTPHESSAGTACSIIDCTAGDKFIINALGGTSGRAWGFLDSSNHVLSMADNMAMVTDLELTAPTNAVKLIINDKSGGMSYKIGNNIASKIDSLVTSTGVISLIKNYYIKTSDTPIDLTPMPSSAGRMYAIINCTAGDKFVINAYSDFPAARGWCFIDNTNNAISMADANATITDLELIAPENAVKLIINDVSGGISYKIGNNLGSKVIALETMERGLSNDAKEALLTCFKHVAWSDTNGRDYYDALERALYAGIDLPVVYWNYLLGRAPSNDDTITTGTTGSQSITFDQNRGVYITGGSGSEFVKFEPTEYPTCKKAYVELIFTIPSIEGAGALAVRISNGVSGFNCSMGTISINNILVFRLMYQSGDNHETVTIPKFVPEFNTEYKMRVEYEDGGTNKIYINEALIYETQDITTKWTTANRVMAVGGVSVYIKSMKWGIEEA